MRLDDNPNLNTPRSIICDWQGGVISTRRDMIEPTWIRETYY